MLHISELIAWMQRDKRIPKAHGQESPPRPSTTDPNDNDQSQELPIFEGYPYFVSRLAPAFYHITLLPESMNRQDLFEVVANQFTFNRLNCCLVFDADDCCYFTENDEIVMSNDPPRGGTIISNKLLLPFVPAITSSFKQRAIELHEFQRSQSPAEYKVRLGDLSKGSVQAPSDLVELMRGENLSGVPRGLSRCASCGEWRGLCLDPNPNLEGRIVKVSCLCDNRNFCARCHRRLSTRKLNSNSYNPADGKIWHHPGFVVIKHDCNYGKGRSRDE